MQQSDSVERAVLRALHKRMRIPAATSDADYLSTSLDPRSHNDPLVFKKTYLCFSFLRKWKGLDAGIPLEEVTFNSWRAAESQCFKTNVRLDNEVPSGLDPKALLFISEVQRKILGILGRPNLNRIRDLCRHSAGATFDLRRGSHLADKELVKPTITRRCLPLYMKIYSDAPSSALEQSFDIVRGNRCIMVPKSAKTHRMISAEPTLNVYVQQGLGRYIRERLMLSGIDLGDQTINQDRAFHALVDDLSTIDLSMASDTLCYNLVKLLLPPKWFDLLDASRSELSSYGGSWYFNSKFSSMGNSYTFELESLIFYALCQTMSEHLARERGDEVVPVTVYGDDIICSSSDYNEISTMLTYFGFTLNADKSYTRGSRFFESCGKHFFDLDEVTPVFQKEICRHPHDYVRLYNRLLRGSIRLKLRDEFKPALFCVLDYYKKNFSRAPVPFGPLVDEDAWFCDPDFSFRGDSMKILALREVKRVSRYAPEREEACYKYKLRHWGSYSNSSKLGYFEESTPHAYSFRRVRIWRSCLRM